MLSTLNGIKVRLLSCGLLVLFMLVAGCSSTMLKSQRLAAGAEPGKEFGIIYQMTKPQFTIATVQRTDMTTALKYTLNVEFIPDSERRFAVSANPGKFRESDISVSLNSNGSMTGLTQTAREQITPTIKAIGDFTTSIIGAAATVAGIMPLEAGQDTKVTDLMKKELIHRLEEYQKKEEKVLLIDTPDLDVLVPCWPNITDIEQAKLEQRLRSDANTIKKRLEGVSKKRNYNFTHLSNALKPEVETVQVNILKVLAEPIDKNIKENEKEFEKQLKKLETSFPYPSQTVQLLNYTTLVERELAWERELIEGEVQFAMKNEDLLKLFGYSDLEVANDSLDSPALKEKKNELKTQASDLATEARKVVMSKTAFPNLLGPLIKDKTPAQQIYQQVKDVQEKIVKKMALLVKEPDPRQRKVYQKEMNDLTRDFHETIGAADEYAEILKLQKMIKDGPPKATNVAHSSPLQEYAAARAQITALNEAVTLKLGKLAADAADTPPARQPEWNPVPVETAFCWNVRRDKMEGKPEPPLRILVPKGTKEKAPTPAERVASRVALQYGADINSRLKYPKYVVVIEEVKP